MSSVGHSGCMTRGTINLPMAELVELTTRDNDIYLQFDIHHPRHGTEIEAMIDATRRAREAMERGLPQVGPGYMLSVAGQNMYLGADGPILNVGIYDAADVEQAFLNLVDSLESEGWSGAISVGGAALLASATYLPDERVKAPVRRVVSASFSTARPPVAARVADRVTVDEARIEHSYQEGMDRHYGWLRFECSAGLVEDAARAMANGLAEAVQRTEANTTRAGDDDYLSLGSVRVSPKGPFVELEDIGDFRKLRDIIRELAEYLGSKQLSGVLTILDHREGIL